MNKQTNEQTNIFLETTEGRKESSFIYIDNYSKYIKDHEIMFLYLVLGLYQKTQIVLSRVFSHFKYLDK